MPANQTNQASIEQLWLRFDDFSEAEFRVELEAFLAQLPAGDPQIAFERGGFFDSTGHPEQAIPLYRQALAEGLAGAQRRQLTVQLASSLRNLGELDEAEGLLRAEVAMPQDEYTTALQGFLALVLSSQGRDREALSLSLLALVPHLPKYQRSMTNYAQELLED